MVEVREINKLDCIKDKWSRLEKETIKQDDLELASRTSAMGPEYLDHEEVIGMNINKTMLCEFPIFVKDTIKESRIAGEKDPTNSLVSEAFQNHIADKENAYVIGPNFLAANRVVEECKHIDNTEQDNILLRYQWSLMFSGCTDLNTIKWLEEVSGLSMLTYDEAAKEMGVDHTEL